MCREIFESGLGSQEFYCKKNSFQVVFYATSNEIIAG